MLSNTLSAKDTIIANNSFRYRVVDYIIAYYGYFENYAVSVMCSNNVYTPYNSISSYEKEIVNLRYLTFPNNQFPTPKYYQTNKGRLSAFDFTLASNTLEEGLYFADANNIGAPPLPGNFIVVVYRNNNGETRLAFGARSENMGFYIQKKDSEKVSDWCKVNSAALEGYTEETESSTVQPGDIGTTKLVNAIILRTNGNTWVRADGSPIKNSGTALERPETTKLGTVYYDTDLDRPIFKARQNSDVWYTADGFTAAKNSGSTAERPSDGFNGANRGFQYYDTTLNKPIWWTGSIWVDANGNNVDTTQTETTTDS